jgi:NAD(P)-dependent dehydrogenase (short-subunit alcohol dehydrogenase family)
VSNLAPATRGQRDAVLVTGATSGIGLETALHLAGLGFRVYAGYRDENNRQPTLDQARQRGVELELVQIDIVDQASIDTAVSRMIAEAGGIYGLVNNAGLNLRGCVEDLSEAEIRQAFDVNVFGTMAVTRQVLPHLREVGRGRIVTITSVGGRIASFGLAAYCATKFALEGWGEALSLEIAPFGLHSVLVEPGIIKTRYWTTRRGTAANSLLPTGPYYDMFTRHELLSDQIADRSRNRTADVARVVGEALTARRPRLRYIVGGPATVSVLLRRYLPNRLFERVYFGYIQRRITGGTSPPPAASTGWLA